MNSIELYAKNKRYDLLSKFETAKEFNNHFEQIMLKIKDKFTKSEYIALNKLRKFACSDKSPDTIGVAFCKAQKAVAATHKDSFIGISRNTFDRMLRKAKKFNLITVINQYRKDKSQMHNVYVFNRLDEIKEDDENVRIVSENQTKGVALTIDEPITMILKLPVLKDKKTYSQAKNDAHKENESISFEESKTEYQQMSENIEGLFNDKKITYRMYGVWLSSIKKMKNKPSFDLCKRAIHTLIKEVKRRYSNDLRPLNNPTGYFSGILSKMLDKLHEEQQLERWENGFAPATMYDEIGTNSVDRLEQFKNVFYSL